MTTTRFTKVRRYKRSVGKRCLHCGRPATVTATRKGTMRLDVRYCTEHADLIIGGAS